MRTPASEEPPLYVPAEFEAEHLDEARRMVIHSCLRRSPPPPLVDRLRGPQGRWTVAVAAHLTAAAVALVFTAVTRTWVAGLAVLIGVSVSLGVTLLIRNRIEAGHRPGANAPGAPRWPRRDR